MNRKGPWGPVPTPDNDREHFSGRIISSEALTIGDIPTPGSSWMDVFEFALTYDAYKEKGGFDPVAKIANKVKQSWNNGTLLPTKLDVLRLCLFFEQRRCRHFDQIPDDDDSRYFISLIDAIRLAVAKRTTTSRSDAT